MMQTMFNSMGDALITTDKSGIVTNLNPAAASLTGWTLSEAHGAPLDKIFHVIDEDSRLRVESPIVQILRDGKVIDISHHVLVAKDGVEHPIDHSAAPIWGEQGNIEGAVLVFHVHQRAEEEMAMAQLAAIIESSDDSIIGMDLEGIITSWNGGAERLYGYTSEEAIGKPISILIPPGHMDEELAFLEKLRQGEGIAHYETERMCKNRGILYVSLTISPIKNRAGRVIGASKIARDISDRKHAEQERAEMHEREHVLRTQAEAANRAKDDFLATLSHELRTPLNAILGWTQTLNRGQLDQETLTRGLMAIEQSARLQTTLIDDLLNVSDIVSGRMRLEVKPLNLVTVITAVVESLRPAIEAKEIDFATQLNDAKESFNGDAARIQQIIWNLLSNAVKFTPRRGRIRLSLARHESHEEITVEDNGIGIDSNFLPYVFHRFRQAESGTKRRYGGLGLGLAIVRHLAELHGGTVEAESPGAGQGARFTVRLPIGALEPMESPRPAESPATTKTPPIMTPLGRLDGLRILSVDDDHNSREMLQKALQHAGAEVISAASAAEALRLLQRFRPDVIVSDIGLPEKDGYDLLRAVRALPPEAGGSTPAVALTGYVSDHDRLATEKAGYQVFISKPVNLSKLIDTVLRVFRIHAKHTTAKSNPGL